MGCIFLKVKEQRGQVMNNYGNPKATFNRVFEYQSIASEILKQPSRYNRTESNLIADEKGPHDWNQLVVWVIHLYVYIYCKFNSLQLDFFWKQSYKQWYLSKIQVKCKRFKSNDKILSKSNDFEFNFYNRLPLFNINNDLNIIQKFKPAS